MTATQPLVIPDRPVDERPVIVVAALCLRDDAGRLLTVRKRGTTRFMLPGGKLDPGESPREAAVREAHEETGLVIDPGEVHLLGEFRSLAANEADTLLVSTVYTVPVVADPGTLRAAAEIAELRWLDVHAPLPGGHDEHDLAPMLADHVLPALREG